MSQLTTSRNILLISPDEWSHIFVSKHHYAVELCNRGSSVYFLNPPNPGKCNTIVLHKPEGYSGITVVDYPGQVRGMRFLPAFIRILLNKHFLSQLETLAECRFDVIWNFENSRFADLQFAGSRLKIYHQVDLNQTFNLAQAARSADVCFCTTDLIRNKLLPYNKKVYKIHHGTGEEALAFNYSTSKKSDTSIKAVYIGNIDMPFLDLELLKNLVISFPHVQFQLIGPYSRKGRAYKLLQSFTNINWLGKIHASGIPAYLNDADLLIVLYAEKHHDDQASPHKFMEYFASGRVVVATYTDEYKDKRHLLCMSDDQRNYTALFSKVLSSIDQYNQPELEEERKAFARENSYKRQLDRIAACCHQNNLDIFG